MPFRSCSASARLAIAALLFLPLCLSGQELGSVSLHLGEPQVAVLDRLSRYKLTRGTPSNGFWSVSDTTEWSGGPNYGNVGSVQFRDGKLVAINRSWKATARDAVGAAALIVAALRQLEGQSDCSVASEHFASPEVRAEIMKVSCASGHTIALELSDQNGGRFYHIVESWLRPKR